ncbi:PucR family transcriptional regulator [Sporosarcina sp. CAU 1771]
MNDIKLDVQAVLTRDSFKTAKLVAGFNGIDRTVKWSHILETNEFNSLINGGELILTTGVGLQHDLSSQLEYVKNLIEKGVACLCIEIGTFVKKISPEVIELANQQKFPIIIFEEIVKFVDITQDLHSFIINQHHEMLSQLDKLSRKFIDLSLSHNGILKILQELHEHFGSNVFFISESKKPYYYPTEIKQIEIPLRAYIQNELPENAEQKIFPLGEDLFALMPVRVLGQIWGYLCLQTKHPVANEFLFLILDRAALAIAQILLRNQTIEERKQNLEDKFVRTIVSGREYEQDDLHSYLPPPSRNMHFRMFIIQLNSQEFNFSEEEWDEVKLQRSMIVRSLFKQQGFFPTVSARRNEIVVIASFIAADYLKKDHSRFLQIQQTVLQMKASNFIQGSSCKFGISMVYTNVSDIPRSYDEARKVLELHDSGILQSDFYEKAGIYRLLLPLKEANLLEIYCKSYLDEVFEYDRKMGANLFETLSVLLECSGSKKETSDRLFIVRQTLYHRIDRLESILGKDFMEPANRIALEVAIHAHQLITFSD